MLNTVNTVASSSGCGCLVRLLVFGEKTFCVLKEESLASLFDMAQSFAPNLDGKEQTLKDIVPQQHTD